MPVKAAGNEMYYAVICEAKAGIYDAMARCGLGGSTISKAQSAGFMTVRTYLLIREGLGLDLLEKGFIREPGNENEGWL